MFIALIFIGVIWFLYGRRRYRLEIYVHWQDYKREPVSHEKWYYLASSVMNGLIHATWTAIIAIPLMLWVLGD